MKSVIILLATVVVLLSMSVALQFKRDAQAREEQRQQIIYLCTVARALDPIVIAVARSSQDLATRQRFRAAHIVLSQTQPCGKVEG